MAVTQQMIVHFAMEIIMLIITQEYTFFIYNRIRSAVKRVELISDKMTCKVLRGCWCDIVMNVHAPPEDKSDDMSDSFYEELAHIFNQFLKYQMKMQF
jgi:hypothetical protein